MTNIYIKGLVALILATSCALFYLRSTRENRVVNPPGSGTDQWAELAQEESPTTPSSPPGNSVAPQNPPTSPSNNRIRTHTYKRSPDEPVPVTIVPNASNEPETTEEITPSATTASSEQWSNVGRDTPKNALETFFWAGSQQGSELTADMVSWASPNSGSNATVDAATKERVVRMTQQWMGRLENFDILGEEIINESNRRVLIQYETNSGPEATQIQFTKNGEQWSPVLYAGPNTGQLDTPPFESME